jgi:ketosteroid isomerase-like protein
MSQDNVEIVRLLYERLNRTARLDRNAYVGDATFDASRLPGFGTYTGFDEFNAAWTQYRDTFDNWWIEVEELLEGKGNRVFVAVRDGGRLKASGSEVRQQFFHVCEMQAGKVTAWADFLDRSEALEAAGLRQ